MADGKFSSSDEWRNIFEIEGKVLEGVKNLSSIQCFGWCKITENGLPDQLCIFLIFKGDDIRMDRGINFRHDDGSNINFVLERQLGIVGANKRVSSLDIQHILNLIPPEWKVFHFKNQNSLDGPFKDGLEKGIIGIKEWRVLVHNKKLRFGLMVFFFDCQLCWRKDLLLKNWNQDWRTKDNIRKRNNWRNQAGKNTT